MIYELEPKAYEKVRPVFKGLENRVAIQAIIEGNSPGRIFVDAPVKPTTAFIWSEFRYSYLAGGAEDDAFNESLHQLLAQQLLPEARESHDPTLVLYPHPESWRKRIATLIRDQLPIELTRRTFTFDPARFQQRGWPERIPPGFCMQRIDEQLLTRSDHKLAVGIRTLWRSASAFLAQGAGFCLLDLNGDEMVSTCFSAFAGGNKREIAVDTDPQYRRRGFATLTAAAFITHCLQHDLEPVWECWADNSPSTGLAGKLGFAPDIDYPVYFFDLKKESGYDL
jgi:GNAT superfamily N-acetyltransferase